MMLEVMEVSEQEDTGGFLYVMRNSSFPNALKIGVTERHPLDRAKELQSTGVPTPFEVVLAIWCSNAYDIEQKIHMELEQYRINPRREFFSITEFQACETVLNSVDYLSLNGVAPKPTSGSIGRPRCFSENEEKEIVAMVQEGKSQKEVAQLLEVSRSTISRIVDKWT